MHMINVVGPGLAIRVICAEEPYREKDFAETQIILKNITDYANAIKKVNWNDFICLLAYDQSTGN